MTGPYWYINLAEAVLWGTLAVAVLVAAAVRRRLTPRAILLVVALAAFGLSDVVETDTGAWWRPWWLLAWKGACVALLGWFAFSAAGRRRRPG